MNEKVAALTEAEGEKILRDVVEQKSGISHEQGMENLISETVLKAHGKLD